MASLNEILAEREAAFSLFDGRASHSRLRGDARGYEQLAEAPVAAAAQAPVCAAVATAAQPGWTEGISVFDEVSAAKRRMMRAFRGYQAWRDPA